MNTPQRKTKRAPRTPKKRKLSGLEKRKRQLAGYLTRQSEKLSPGRKKLLLLVFGILMGSASLVLVTEPFRNVKADSPFAPAEPTWVPLSIYPQDSSASLVPDEEYEMLTGFLHVLDSLKQHDPETYRDVLRGREGLIDSVRLLIPLYE